MEVKVKTKYEVHIYLMLALPCMHDNLLKKALLSLCTASKVVPISKDRRKKIQVKHDLRKLY